MKKSLIFILSISLMLSLTPNSWAIGLLKKYKKTEFVAGIEDLPIYNGFKLVEGSDISYDTKDGRIIEASYIGVGGIEQINQFYNDTLPQIGWNEIKKGHYKRDEESLKIGILEKNDRVVLKFSINPVVY